MNAATLTSELMAVLFAEGAELAGIGDMTAVNCGYRTGVSVAVALPAHVIADLMTAPTREYYDLYHTLNARLNRIVTSGESFLRENGFAAYAQTTDRVNTNAERISPLPHKTVATRAGIGWIGRNCLLVTPQYGPAIRLSSLLTDAPLECSKPVTASRCGGCGDCVATCPAGALRGATWSPGLPRADILDFRKCYDKQLEIMKKNVGIETDLCGKCFAVCRYARRYMERGASSPGDV